ncbi:MAG: DUF2029 domain-containing protein [Sandaracinaceae bacterium]|nr:DUF2029 domain-containing protein [Sandaracinaceae bacterium]
MEDAPPRSWPLETARIALLVAAVGLHGVLGVSLASSWGTDEFARRDWAAFRDAAARVLDGRVEGLYDPRPGGFPYLHPPWVAAVLAPFGHLGDGAFYALMVALQGLGLAMAVLALRSLEPEREGQDAVVLGILASAPWVIGLVLGQPSALVLGAWLVAFALVARDRPVLAGVLFGLCAIKPPYVVAPILFALLSRRPKILSGMAASIGALFVASLVVGHWPEWLAAVGRTLGDVSDGHVALWKQHTLLAFLRAVAPRPVALGIYALAVLGFGGLFFRARGADVPPIRAAGWLALGTLTLSPFAYFYDALLLILPAAALWLRRDTYPRNARRALAVLALATFAAQHLGFFALQAGPPWAGLLVTGWLLVEVWTLPPPAKPGSLDHRVAELDGQPDGDATEPRGDVVRDG